MKKSKHYSIIIILLLAILICTQNISECKTKDTSAINIDEQVELQIKERLKKINQRFDFCLAWVSENYIQAMEEFSRKNYGGAIVYFIKATMYTKYITPRFHLAKAITYLMIHQKENAIKEVNIAIKMCKSPPWNRLESTPKIYRECLKLSEALNSKIKGVTK